MLLLQEEHLPRLEVKDSRPPRTLSDAFTAPTGLTKVDAVLAPPLAVHLVHEEAGHGFEQQVEDGHPRTEAEHAGVEEAGGKVDSEVDDVGQNGHRDAHQKLQGGGGQKTSRGRGVRSKQKEQNVERCIEGPPGKKFQNRVFNIREPHPRVKTLLSSGTFILEGL